MKLVFLDIDGVLNNYYTPSVIKIDKEKRVKNWRKFLDQFESNLIFNLNKIHQEIPEIKYVIISEWLRSFPLEIIVEIFRTVKFTGTIIDGVKKPENRKHKGLEIKEWLESNSSLLIDNFVIIDDAKSGMFYPYEKHHIRTNMMFGITNSDVRLVIERLT